MTVSELMEKLARCDGNREVVTASDSSGTSYDITSINSIEPNGVIVIVHNVDIYNRKSIFIREEDSE